MAQAHQHDQGAHATEALAHGTRIQSHHPREAGTMDISTQEATFAGFMRFLTRMGMLIVVFLIFLALIGG